MHYSSKSKCFQGYYVSVHIYSTGSEVDGFSVDKATYQRASVQG